MKKYIADYHSSNALEEIKNGFDCFVDVDTDSEDSDERYDSRECYTARVIDGVIKYILNEDDEKIGANTAIYKAITTELNKSFL